MFDINVINSLIDAGKVKRTKHPEFDYYIYCYSKSAQFENKWSDTLRACRGLILDVDGNVIARPMPKFFNIEQHSRSDTIFRQKPQIFEKVDGTLLISYQTPDGEFRLASKSSFVSPQAVEGTKFLTEFLDNGFVIDPDYTYLFEFVHPSNRIVVDYGDFSGLVFLCAIHKGTGANVFEFGDERDFPGLHAKRFAFDDVHPRDLHALIGSGEEGFVLYFTHGDTRVKVKSEEYKRLHAVVTGTSTMSIWKALANGENFTALVELMPDEFHAWATKVHDVLVAQYDAIYDRVEAAHVHVCERLDPKFELSFYNKKYAELAFSEYRDIAACMFRLRDGGSPSDMIWKMLKPSVLEWPPSMKDLYDD